MERKSDRAKDYTMNRKKRVNKQKQERERIVISLKFIFFLFPRECEGSVMKWWRGDEARGEGKWVRLS